jgi:polyphosphate kinase 2
MSKRNDEDFRIDMTKLPDWIADNALTSGGFPYDRKLPNKQYERELRDLQIELVKLLNWVKAEGERIAIVFEGRDAAGKGGAIQRLTAHLNPRSARVVALPKATSTEAGQWYFQRYVHQLPTKGEIAIFDRSWYNRAGVEPVFGFCTEGQTKHFLREAPEFEAMLERDGVRLVKFFLSIGKEMQMKRLQQRWRDPLDRWKISEIDEKAIQKWSDYSAAYNRALRKTDTKPAPWTVIRANDKRRARLETIRHLLDAMPYAHKDEAAIGKPDRKIAISAEKFLEDGGEEA